MKKISILLIEDELALLERLIKYVSIFCDTVYHAANGKEALLVHEKYHPNIIITDINMPKLTGIEFIEKIRKSDKESQIIILSGHTHTQDLLKVIPLNLIKYLVKPIEMEELKHAILEAIATLEGNQQINLNHGYKWNQHTKSLSFNNELISLTSYEVSFLDCITSKLNKSVSYEEIHNFIYDFEIYSQHAIFTIAKRIRKKTQKDFIKSCYKFGYKVESD